VLAVAAVGRNLSDDVRISVVHNCVVVDLWQSPSEWYLLLSECVLVCHRENIGTNITYLVKLGKSGCQIGEMVVQVYWANAMKTTAVCKLVTRFPEGRGSVTDEESSGPPATSRTATEAGYPAGL
jgi:hypothetical protein